ncbi:C6 transcription factor [Penicillium maclennaniae]|uniref:C6 transcription factor n=1 Tax=Penicillium maclennaniae TaxID=1343394 RepID=UPI002541843A|nr:C6 transcription factor [Penicillium maclennaniae]KAJ5674961.1 C6 transcription factor [Penicillium maclennaniae]
MNRQREAEKALHDQTNILPFGQLMVVFTGLAISLLITMVDQNGISVTLPTIARDLEAANTISWAGTSSLIANTMFTVLYGRLSDIFGRKIVPAMFYVFRGLAGVAGGGVTSLTMIIVSDIVTLEKRGKYQGILGSTWRGFFWLISPLSACSAVVGYYLIPNNARRDGFGKNLRRIDWFGSLASSIGIIFILIPISGGGSYFNWDSAMVISMLVIGGCAFIAFFFIEWKVAALPMLPVHFFKNKVISALFLQSFLLGAVYQSYLYYLPLYYQNGRGWSPIVSAALTAPMVTFQSIASICSGQYISRLKRYGEIIWVGFGLWTLGAGLTLLFDAHTHPAVIAVIVAITGTGIGFTFQPTLVALQAHCTKAQRAISISNRNFFRCMGGACGLAISAALLQATLRSTLPAKFSYLTKSTYTLPSRSSVTDTQWGEILTAYSKASHSVFILQVPLIGVCFLACCLVRDRGLERVKDPEEIEAEKRAQAERDAEAAVAESQPGAEGEAGRPPSTETAEKRHSTSTFAESSMPPSRADPDLAGTKENHQGPASSRQNSPASKDYNPRKRGRTACTRCKTRKQRCDNEYPTCSNCQKAGVTCDKSRVREDADRENDIKLHTRSGRKGGVSRGQTRPRANPSQNVGHVGSATWSPKGGRVTPQTASGLETNPVGEMVGLLALSSSEAPAYVGSSSGLSLAANLGEMVQTSVWNQFISRMHEQQAALSAGSSQNPSGAPAGISQPGSCARTQDRPRRMEELLPAILEPPSDEMGARLLDTYFHRLHSRYPFLDRRQMWRIHEERERLYKTKREELSQPDRFALFKLNMVYAIGATMLRLSDTEKYVSTAPERYYTFALQYVPTMCEARSVENIEAMVLLVVYHLRTASSHGMWYMIGLAMRTAIDLGLHRKANEINMDPFTTQIRRRLFWVVYYLERVVSMSLGRPFSISDRHIDLDLPVDVEDDTLDPALLTNPQPHSKPTSLTFAIYLFKLRRIDSRIQHKIYRADRPLSSLRPKMDPLYLELEEWKESALQRFTGTDLDYPMLHYNRAVRLLIQPFLPLLPITDPYYNICLRAAGEICQTHKRLHQTLEYGHSFLAVQTVFMAVLFVMGERAAWVKKYRDAFELLVNAAMEKLQGNETARNTNMAELMTAQHGGVSLNTAMPGMSAGEKFSPANPQGLAPEGNTPYQADEADHAVRMALQLAPWIDQDQNDPLWMPDFETLENLSGNFWSHADTTLFDAL